MKVKPLNGIHFVLLWILLTLLITFRLFMLLIIRLIIFGSINFDAATLFYLERFRVFFTFSYGLDKFLNTKDVLYV